MALGEGQAPPRDALLQHQPDRRPHPAAAVRRHWGIEHGVHRVPDLAFREDRCRVRVGHGAGDPPGAFSLLRRLALNLLRQDPAPRCGVKGRRLRAALKPHYLLAVLRGSSSVQSP